MEENVIVASPLCGLLPLMGLAAVLVMAIAHDRSRAKRGARRRAGTIAWTTLFCALLAFAAAWGFLGLLRVDMPTLGAFVGVMMAGGVLSVARDPVLDALEGFEARGVWQRVISEALRLALAAPVILFAAQVAFVASAVPWNDGLYGYLQAHDGVPAIITAVPEGDPAMVAEVVAQMPEGVPAFATFDVTFILMALVIWFFLAQRSGAGIAACVLSCAFFGLAQYFVAMFKGSAILPSDLMALGTALAVSGGYVYELNTQALLGLVYAGMACVPCVLVAPSRVRTKLARLANVAVNLVLCAYLCQQPLVLAREPDYPKDFGVGLEYWFTLDTYSKQGYSASFLAMVDDMEIEPPEGYDEAGAKQLMADLAASLKGDADRASRRAAASQQFDELKPSVVFIMNETFADASEFSAVAQAGYDGPQTFKGIDDALLRGEIAVSAYAGGTCNTEFEVITSTSLAFVGPGKYPYALYDLTGCESLAKTFSSLGYATTAIHPNLATNWNRASAYGQLGFDRFLSIDDFAGAPELHSGVTDAATYDRILQILADDEAPQFVYDVTMQNHSGYNKNDIPADMLTHYQVQGLDDDTNAQLNEYISCIEASDADLAVFLDELRGLDRPVVLVFFGDHQASLSGTLNEVCYPGEQGVRHVERMYHTSYVIWANYDVEGSAQVSEVCDTATCYLAALALDAIGAPLSTYQSAQLAIARDMDEINLMGCRGADGSWFGLKADGPYAFARDNFETIEYLVFGSRYAQEQDSSSDWSARFKSDEGA